MKPNRETVEAYTLAGIGAVGGAFKYYVQPELTAKRGWMAVGALVGAYELFCPENELLSQGVDRAIEKHPLLVTAAIGAVAFHLANVYEHLGLEAIDPIHQLTKLRHG